MFLDIVAYKKWESVDTMTKSIKAICIFLITTYRLDFTIGNACRRILTILNQEVTQMKEERKKCKHFEIGVNN